MSSAGLASTAKAGLGPASPARASGRLPQLDGLRALAVLLVIAAHVGFLLRMPLAVRTAAAPVLSGDGVELFFVLSGYLITGLLVRERVRTGRVSLTRFYLRRVLRIWPAFYAFLGVTGLLVLLGLVQLHGLDLLLSALFVWNYVPRVVPWIEHTWSLAVEEQFYLLWPLVLVRVSPRRALSVALVVVVVSPALRAATLLAFPGASVSFMTHGRADALLAGAALALAPVAWPAAYAGLVRVVLRWHLDALALVGFLVLWPYSLSVESRWTAVVLSRTPLAVAGAVLLLGLLERPRGPVARVLSTRPVVHVGVLSYSLYLWQEPFLIPEVHLPLPLRVLGAVVAAELSLWLVERPFLRVKRRFEPRCAAPRPAPSAPAYGEVGAR